MMKSYIANKKRRFGIKNKHGIINLKNRTPLKMTEGFRTIKMKNSIIIGLSAGILVLLLAFFCDRSKREKELQSLKELYKKEVLKNDSLVKVNEMQYRKLVADTLTIRELEKEIKELGIELSAKPKIIEKIVFKPIEIEKPTDSISIEEDNLTIEDYYPQKENYFVKYLNKTNLTTKEGTSTFYFSPVPISIVISQRDDGIFQSDIKSPEWLTVEAVDILAIPMEHPKIDKFGVLVGVGIGRDFEKYETYGRFSVGVRYKTLYLDVGGGTNKQADASVKIEF